MGATREPGTISWQDLTVEDAEGVRDFYEAVAGWTPEPLSMGAYSDFVMNADGTPVAGICHARAGNAGLPPVWLIYITVDDLDHSLEESERLGGSLLRPPRSYGGRRHRRIKKPAPPPWPPFQPPPPALSAPF